MTELSDFLNVISPAAVAWSSDRCIVLHGDSLELCPAIPTESFDLVVTDPPYGVEYRSNLRAERFDAIELDKPSDRAAVTAIMAQAVRLVGQRRHLYVFGPVEILNGLKVSEPTELIWDKTVMSAGDLTSPWGTAHERITFAVSLHRHAGKTGSPALPVRMRKGSVLRFGRKTGRTVRHPSEKPTGLLRELIESSSRQDDIVFDPFAGVGSTGVAAIQSGRRAVLIECNRGYVDIAIDRIQRAEALASEVVSV